MTVSYDSEYRGRVTV